MKEKKVTVAVFVFFLALFALTNQGFVQGEGFYHYRLAERIVDSAELDIDPNLGGPTFRGPDGRTYIAHEFGNTLFMLPTAAINSIFARLLGPLAAPSTIERIAMFVVSFQSVLYCAVTCAVLFLILRVYFLVDMKLSLAAVALMGLSTYFWTYSRNSFDGVLCAMLLSISLLTLFLYKQTRNSWFLVGTFISLGFSIITRLSMMLVVGATLIYLILICKRINKERLRVVVIAMLTLLPFVGWQMWYNTLRTGTYYQSPVQTEKFAVNNALDGDLGLGLAGLILSPGKSIFVYSPILILSVLLFRRFYRKWKDEAVFVCLIWIGWMLLHAKLRSWYGAWGWGPRHFVTILPVIVLPFATNIDHVLNSTKLRISAITLSSFGFLLTVCSLISNYHYRLAYAQAKGYLGDDVFVWGVTTNQAIDMVLAGFMNIWRMASGSEIETVETGYSRINEHVSSTLNVWPHSLADAGIPWPYIVVSVMLLLSIIGVASIQIVQAIRVSVSGTSEQA